MKLIEAVMQLRPRSLWRVLAHPDRGLREAMRWYYRIGRQVWPHELWHFLSRDRRIRSGPTLTEFLGDPQDAEDEALMTSPRLKPLPCLRPDQPLSQPREAGRDEPIEPRAPSGWDYTVAATRSPTSLVP